MTRRPEQIRLSAAAKQRLAASSLTPQLRVYLTMLLDPETAWDVPQSACDRLESLGFYAERGGVTEEGKAVLR